MNIVNMNEDQNFNKQKVIKLEDVHVLLQKEVILSNVNLSLEKGKCLVLIGPSGQGKSIILKLIAGIILPTKGKVYIEGKNFNKMNTNQKKEITKNMGMLFQKNALFDSLTIEENINFPLKETTSLSYVERSKRIKFFLDQVGLSGTEKLYPHEISGGMQKRLGIARALALEPQIILYDDPTAGLDPINSSKIIELIIKLKKQNESTIIVVTNDMNRAYQLADIICMVVDKQIIVTGSINETLNHSDPRVKQFITGSLSGPLSVIG